MTLKLARVPGQGTNYVQHIPESVHFQDNYEFRYIMLARLLWFTSLSGADIVSVGMSQSDNPQQFRKLVFWAKSKTEDLQSVSSDVDNIIQQVTTIGDSYKQMAADRQAAAAIAKTNDVVRAMAAKKALNAIIAGSNNVTAESIIDLLEPASSTNQPAVTKQ